jgi:hypothetical protein
MTAARDRDPAGRPRNSRPRDELGRPLPREAGTGTPRVPDDLAISPAQAADLGAALLARGRPFHAHEVFEAAWKSGPPGERGLWQGLAQVAAGITHARRGNAAGAVALLRRGARHVAACPAPQAARYGIDAGFVAARAGQLADRIEAAGPEAVSGAELLLPLAPR